MLLTSDTFCRLDVLDVLDVLDAFSGYFLARSCTRRTCPENASKPVQMAKRVQIHEDARPMPRRTRVVLPPTVSLCSA